MLISNLGIAMNTHYCGGLAVENSVSIGAGHLDCGMANMETMCETSKNQGTQILPEPCCQNTHQVLQLDDNVDVKASKIELNHDFVIAFVQTFMDLLPFSQETQTQYAYYSPPLLHQDIPVLFQSFLI